jgi:hypothetical protein
MARRSYLSDLARLLATSLSDSQLRSIGQIAVLWNSAEASFQQLIWMIANWDDFTGQLVTADLNNPARHKLAQNISNLKISDDEVRRYLLLTIDLFDKARSVRNDIVHGLPKVEQGAATSDIGTKRTAKAGVGAVRITHCDISESALEDFISDLSTLGLAIESSIRQCFTLQMMAGGTLRAEHRKENLERASLLDIASVQRSLESLQARHRAPRSSPSRPGSSQE